MPENSLQRIGFSQALGALGETALCEVGGPRAPPRASAGGSRKARLPRVLSLPWAPGAGQRWERTPFPPRPTSASLAGQKSLQFAGASSFQFYFCRTGKQGSAGQRSRHPLASHVVSGKEKGIPFFLHFLLNLGGSSQEKSPVEAQAPTFAFTQATHWFWAHLIFEALHQIFSPRMWNHVRAEAEEKQWAAGSSCPQGLSTS